MQKRKRSAAFILTVAAVCIMAFSALSMPVSAAKKVTVSKVSVVSSLSGNKKTVYVAKGKKVKLKTTVTVVPDKEANKKVTYKSMDKKIATVNSKGMIKGVKAGETKITVTSKKNPKKKAKITVKVTKAPVQKVELDKSGSSMMVGDSVALKATVTGKKTAVKEVVWASSNAKVAAVDSSGNVKAVSSGTATVTAKAIDGSGQEASCFITVTNPTNLVSMNILNAQTITFSLNQAYALKAGQITVMMKENKSGAYRRTLSIQSMTTVNNKDYSVIVSSESRIAVNHFVQISISSLPGNVKAVEKEYLEQACAFTDDEISVWSVGAYGSETFTFAQSNGYSQYEVSGLPAGLTAAVESNAVVVRGTPSRAGVVTAVLKATDEYGNTLTKNIYFAVGSDTVIAGAAAPVYALSSAQVSSISVSPSLAGGSGSYKYRIIADPQNSGAHFDSAYVDAQGYSSRGEVQASITIPGDYTVTVRAYDSQNGSRICDIPMVFHVKQGISIGGCIKDAQGNPMNDGRVTFTNKNRADRYSGCSWFYVDSNTGVYSAILSPGTYDIEADRSVESEAGCATNYLYNQTLTVSRTGFDISLPLYKVQMVSNDAGINTGLQSRAWYYNQAKVGEGAALYVKPGNYVFETEEFVDWDNRSRTESGDWFNGKTVTETVSTVKYSAPVNVGNTAVRVSVQRVPIGTAGSYSIYYPAARNTGSTLGIDYGFGTSLPEVSVYDSNNQYYVSVYTSLRVTVEASGSYRLSSAGNRVKLYDEQGREIAGSTESGGKRYDSLPAGTYFIGTGSYENYDYNIQMTTISLE